MRRQDRATDVYRQQRIDVRQLEVGDGVVESNGSIVDEDVEAAQCIDGVFDGPPVSTPSAAARMSGLTLETIILYVWSMNDIAPTRHRAAMGRPRAFDMETVIARAVPVFREHGYEGASIDRLKTATGLTAGSLYKAFKDKRGVFAAAFSHYVETRQGALAKRLHGSLTGRERIAEVLRFYLASASGHEGRQGCLVLASLIEATTLDEALRDTLRKTLADNRAVLLTLLQEGQQDGSISADLAIEPCADLLISLLQGFRAMGKLHDPAHHEALIAIALKTLD